MAEDRNPIAARAARGPESGALETSSGQAEEIYTAKELHHLLKISVKTIYGYVQRGLIPYVRIQSNVRFPRRQILEWIERQSYQPRPPHDRATKRP